MDFIFDDDVAVDCFMGNQLIGRLKLDGVAIASELGHQIDAPHDNARPTGEVVENLVDNVFSDNVEEMLAIDEVAQRPSNEIEVRALRPRRQCMSDSPPGALRALRGPTYKIFASRSQDRLSPPRVC